MNKSEKIIKLTSNKTKQYSITLNNELIELFKAACKQNNMKPTKLFEIWMINYIEESGLL